MLNFLKFASKQQYKCNTAKCPSGYMSPTCDFTGSVLVGRPLFCWAWSNFVPDFILLTNVNLLLTGKQQNMPHQ